MNRIIACGLQFLLIISLSMVFSCGKTSDQEVSEEIRIAVIPKGTSNVFWQTVHAGALTAAKELGVEVLWSGPNVETDKERQVAIIDDFVAQAVDGIVLAPQDANAMIPPVNRIASAGIPLVIIDSGINSDAHICYVATDNYQGGVEGAQELARLIGGKGKVVIIGNDPGGESTSARENGFKETMQKVFPDIEVAGFQFHYNARQKARAIMEDFLVSIPDLNGVFCSSESSTLGALVALRAAQVTDKISFVGFDSSPELADAMKEGDIEAIVHQDPFGIGYHGLETMVRYLRGEEVDKRFDTNVYVVTPDNMTDPDISRLLDPDLSMLNE
ncbi:MAG: substrate-binding domain-containing protein [bacterium]